MPVLEWIPFVTAISLVLLVVWVVLTNIEQKRGARVFAVRLRSWIDIVIERTVRRISIWYISIAQHRMKLSWYYSIHAVLLSVLSFLAAIYSKIENVVIANRDKAKQIRKAKQSFKKTHLTEIAEHKESVQLSPKEKTRRKNESLKGL